MALSFIPFVLAILIVIFKAHLSWLGDDVIYEAAGSLLVIAVTHLVFGVLSRTLHSKVYMSIVRYCYVAFFLYFIYITGGINSSFIFTLLLPVIAPAISLDKRATRNIAFISTLGFALLIFTIPIQLITPDELVKHIIQTVILGALSYLVVSVVSVTLRQQTEQDEAARRITEMVQVDRLKSDFLSMAQHQLRTPLSGVKWALEMLKADTTLPLESQSLIEASLSRVQDSLAIINQMLKTVENDGTPALARESTDLVGLLRSILAELNFIIIKKGVKITFTAPDSLLINADRNNIKAALVNIVDNAIKYSPKGKVDVSIVDAPTKATLTVRDNGIGIPADDLPYIFDRMHRARNAVLIEPDESGVGLSISKKIIELHGGTISLQSTLNQGTLITVVLPKG